MHSRKKGGRDTGLFLASRLLFLRLAETVSTPGQPPPPAILSHLGCLRKPAPLEWDGGFRVFATYLKQNHCCDE